MRTEIQNYLLTLSKKTLRLAELEDLSPSGYTYAQFADTILSLETEGVLIPIKSHGTNGKHPMLALGYRIRIEPLQKDLHSELVNAKIILHPDIGLERYLKLPYSVWKADFPYIEKIDYYLKNHSLPDNFVPAPERSFELVGNEKWITDFGGKELLDRIGLWTKLYILPVADPLMFAINPSCLQDSDLHHLIVENKTTYQALLPVLRDTQTTTLIYGVGNKIVKSIENFHHQLPVDAHHHFHYFGDIDHAGISIWHRLSKKELVKPALPFYELTLSKQPPAGKTNQTPNEEALEAFTRHFSEHLANQIQTSLEAGLYYPQEIAATNELQACWRSLSWSSMN
ncbi:MULTISPECIES: Wadjet anti-phage system protein JetD domain-containing protein [Sporosarcina]|uniref:Wadjet anti-phage system protein JetD domain-containing protein n=1 Tax=Sporosarcina contaminans TaxID=633403 RepID=A0ABW3U0S1_9BACL